MKIKYIFKIIPIVLLLIILFPYGVASAAEVTSVGNAIGTFAYNYYKSKENGTSPKITWYAVDRYDPASYGKRAIPLSGTPALQPDGTYHLDCVGFVNFCVYNAVGIQDSGVQAGTAGYVAPRTSENFANRQHFDVKPIGSTSELMTGDIIVESGHVSVFVREGTEEFVIDSASTNTEPRKKSYASAIEAGSYYARVKTDVANALNEENFNIDPNLTGLGGSLNSNESEFYFNGIPDGTYSVAGSFWEWIVNALKEIFTFIINIIFYILRMVFVGYTAIMDNLISYIVNSIIGVDAKFFEDSTSGWRKEENKTQKINIETIIFGEEDKDTHERHHIFDVNFFKDPTPAATTP